MFSNNLSRDKDDKHQSSRTTESQDTHKIFLFLAVVPVYNWCLRWEKQREHLQSCGVKQKLLKCNSAAVPVKISFLKLHSPLCYFLNLLNLPFSHWQWQLCIPYFVCICGQMFIIHKVYWLLAQMILSWKHIFRQADTESLWFLKAIT